MADESRYPYVGGEVDLTLRQRRTTLSWKTRSTQGNKPGGAADHGSFYTIMPKQMIRQLGWEHGTNLVWEPREGGLMLTALGERLGPAPAEARLKAPPYDQVICGDVLYELAKIPDNSIHLAITSPPYNVGIRYDRYDDDREYAEYRLWLRRVWKELFRVLVRGGRFVLQNAPTSIADFRPVHTDLTNDARVCGFEFRAEIIWYKQNMSAARTAWGSFRSPGHPHVIPSWEYVNVFHKLDWKLEGEQKNIDISPTEFVEWSNAFWKIAPESSRPGDHPAAFPEELIRRIALYFSYKGQTLLDPFGGTGTVAAVARKTGRRFVHIDQSREYCDVALKRLSLIDNPRVQADPRRAAAAAPRARTASR